MCETFSNPFCQPDNSESSRRVRQANFVSPDKDHMSAALRGQQRVIDVANMAPYCMFYPTLDSFYITDFPICTQVKGDASLQCRFYEIPVAEYIADDLPDNIFDLNDENIRVYSGMLNVNLLGLAGKGKFKTAHPGWVTLDGGEDLPPFTNKRVCVKQFYRERENNGGIARLDGRYELSALVTECNCIQWGSILLDLTYKFIMREIERRGCPKLPIPDLRYTRVMVAIVQETLLKEKAYLVEEWIDNDEGKGEPQFCKYINNRLPASIVPDSAPASAHNIAEFLLFSQHVQWQKMIKGVFVSDYQGAGGLLTDPQITSNPYVPTSMTSSRLTDIFNY